MINTIASLALVRSYWNNESSDYIEIFIPFIVALVNKRKYRVIDISTTCKDFEDEFGLRIPYHPMIAIIHRAKKRGFLYSNNKGEVIPNYKKIVEDDFSDVVQQQNRKYNNVISKFIDYSSKKFGLEISLEKAGQILVSYLRNHDLDILFITQEEDDSLLPEAYNSPEDEFILNDFVIYTEAYDTEIFNYVVDIAAGHIIASTILCRDYSKFQGKLNNLNIYLDTGIILNLIGYDGNNKTFAYKELISSLNEQKANLYIFQHTYDEVLVILSGCLEWINNPNYDPSKANAVLIHFYEQGYSKSDVELKIQNLEKDLVNHGIRIFQLSPQPLINEKDLMSLIINLYKEKDPYFDEIGKDNTIYRDVKSISYIYQLRNGQRPVGIRSAKFIFLTTNSTLAYATRQFEIREFGTEIFTIPATLTDVFIGTLVWLQTPTSISTMNQKIISCGFAALHPSRQMIKKLVSEAKILKENGQISEDDFVLLTQSSIAKVILQEKTLGELEKFTGKTVIEVLEEINRSAAIDEMRKFEEEKKAMITEFSVIEEERNGLLEQVKSLSDGNKTLKTSIEKQAEEYSSKLSNLLLFSLIFIAIILVIPNLFPSFFSLLPKSLQVIIRALSAVFSIISFLYGFEALKLKRKVKSYLYQKYVDRFLIR